MDNFSPYIEPCFRAWCGRCLKEVTEPTKVALIGTLKFLKWRTVQDKQRLTFLACPACVLQVEKEKETP